ncbi:beta-carotene 15,15'-monooxygenase, Brp/Blh family [Halovenus aranensis]|uniref:Probable beta-carotene 15,15'-dioxygenase n=1 Tax=Halovenus aranensis TaxID=890420 RepID=A0A1G8RP78_9EURY|nr:Brp/Blh family beta-carotene 15,15'-dioxygenase [Halovenus aranensis]SDJ18739.1 beta-carotene 15,15'-monooxygenase, Brp/Blh family [Halovenus aranensis]
MTADSARRSLVRLTVVPGWVVFAVITAAFAAGLTVPLRYQFVPLVASVLVFGLPHGAVDHLAPTRVQGQPPTGRSLAAVGVLYAVVGGCYALAWFLAPVASFAVFILITWLHWGQGEVHSLVGVLGVDHLTTPAQRALTALARGTLPMLVPLVAFPEQYRLVTETLVGLFTTPTLGWAEGAFTPDGRLVVGVVVAGLLAGSLALGYVRAQRRRDWLVDAGEVGLLVAYFALVPPVLAVGLYFTCWHALRHVGRLLAIDPTARERLADREYGQALGRFARDAAPLTAVSLVFLGVFYWLVPVAPGSISEWVGLYLVLIAALTLPHVVVVAWLDHQQLVWTSRPALLAERQWE